MSERRPYSYVLLRYRHDTLAGEFGNVGVVLHASETGFLGVRTRGTAGARLAQMFPTMNKPAFRTSLQAIRRGVEALSTADGGGLLGKLGDAAAFARRALPNDDSSFVWGPIGSGVTQDPQKTLDTLYDRFVGQYDPELVETRRDDSAVWKPVHDLLVARQIADKLQPKTIHAVISVDFDHAWKNGAWHVYQPLSFDLASDDHIKDKAAKWAGYMLSLKGADEAFKLHFVVGPPQGSQRREAYKRALDVLSLPDGDAEIVDVSAATSLVDRIEAAMRAEEMVESA
jgi:hypothetical protein